MSAIHFQYWVLEAVPLHDLDLCGVHQSFEYIYQVMHSQVTIANALFTSFVDLINLLLTVSFFRVLSD